MGLPPGYKFFPSKKELIEYYLLKKINGEPIPHNPVKDCDVYGDPMIWRKLLEETGMKTLYFYTKLKNKEKGKKKWRERQALAPRVMKVTSLFMMMMMKRSVMTPTKEKGAILGLGRPSHLLKRSRSSTIRNGPCMSMNTMESTKASKMK